jgi:ATP-dependent Clp protease ATP-binding subunit ClpC
MTSDSRYSHHARRALFHARALAARYHHSAVDTGHLLVGVMLTEGSIGYRVLDEMDLTARRAETYLRNLYPPDDSKLADDVRHAAALDLALTLALDESNWLGHHYIGTEHFLLGITRSNAGSAGALLRKLDASLEGVRRRLLRHLRQGITGELTLQFAKHDARLSELSRRVMTAAEQLAVALDHPVVGLGHLLLVLLQERRSPTSALLRDSGLDEAALYQRLIRREAPLMVTVEIVLSRVPDHVERLGSHYSGTEHLLLTLCLDDAGAHLLRICDLDPDALARRLLAELY